MAREIDEFPVGRKGGAGIDGGLTLAFYQLDALAAVFVVKPQRRGTQIIFRGGIGAIFAGHDVISIGGPGRRAQLVVGFLGDFFRAGAVNVDEPDVVAAAAVADEGDLLAAGRKPGLAIPGRAAGQAAGFPAGGGHEIQVAEEVEDNLRAVGRNVEGDPGAFVGGEADLARGLERQALVFLFVVFGGGLLGRFRVSLRRGRGSCERYARAERRSEEQSEETAPAQPAMT